jgi:hypothetical protein
MHQTLAIITSLAALVGAAGALGCSSSSGGTSCNTNPSFATDVMPVFQRSCTLSSVCHGQMGNSGEENEYLGLNAGGGGSADAKAVYTNLVGVTAKENPSMKIVAPGDLANSYLWHKVNDDPTTLNSGSLKAGCAMATMMCTDCNSSQPCGGTMPYLGESLASSRPADLCTLQNWIMSGAQNN